MRVIAIVIFLILYGALAFMAGYQFGCNSLF